MHEFVLLRKMENVLRMKTTLRKHQHEIVEVCREILEGKPMRKISFPPSRARYAGWFPATA